MRYAWAGVVVCLLIAGCRNPNAGTKVGEKGKRPEVGQKVYLPYGYQSEVWGALESRREYKASFEGDRTAFVKNGSDKRLLPHRLGHAVTGDTVKVLEVGEDFVMVDVMRDDLGMPVNLQGYIDPWW